MIDRAFALNFDVEVELTPVLSRTLSGDKTYDEAATQRVRAFVGLVVERDVDPRGEGSSRELVGRPKVLLWPTDTTGAPVEPRLEDRVTLPIGFEPRVVFVRRLARRVDEGGVHHWTLVC